MHPLPLTGTETDFQCFIPSAGHRDASPTPHGDGNYKYSRKGDTKMDDASPTPHGDGNTETRYLVLCYIDASLPLMGTETQVR